MCHLLISKQVRRLSIQGYFSNHIQDEKTNSIAEDISLVFACYDVIAQLQIESLIDNFTSAGL